MANLSQSKKYIEKEAARKMISIQSLHHGLRQKEVSPHSQPGSRSGMLHRDKAISELNDDVSWPSSHFKPAPNFGLNQGSGILVNSQNPSTVPTIDRTQSFMNSQYLNGATLGHQPTNYEPLRGERCVRYRGMNQSSTTDAYRSGSYEVDSYSDNRERRKQHAHINSSIVNLPINVQSSFQREANVREEEFASKYLRQSQGEL